MPEESKNILLDPIPEFQLSQLELIYPHQYKEQEERYQNILRVFAEAFNGEKPDFLARSPGRVNLIGEHIDYSGYSVLPMAIERDTVMAVAASFPPSSDDKPAWVELVNVKADKYPKRVFNHEAIGHVTIDSTVHEWSNYFKCGYKGVLDELNPKKVACLKIVVDGIVPTGSGLSSSSSFVCCSSLATLHANKSIMNKGELTKTAIKSETYAGVQIGGMDQSISIMAPRGSALLIDFYPTLHATPITIPSTTPAPIFVIANTMLTADKHVTAPRNYNLRVVECRLASAVLVKKLGLTNVHQEVPTLKQVHEAVEPASSDLSKSFGDMIAAVEKHLHSESYTLEEVAGILGISVDQLNKKYVEGIRIEAQHGFKLYQRAKHVFSESSRVYEFRDACLKPPHAGFLKEIGGLMNASHASCKELFECSCPELDELTSLCRAEGAFGSRLTGAGWGGCTVSLVSQPEAKNFIDQIREKYYFKHYPQWRNDKDALDHLDGFLFASPAGIGALTIKL